MSTEKGRNDVGNIPCRPHGVPRAKRGLLIAESLDRWERPPQVEISGKNSRGTVQGLGGLRLSSARPAYKVGLWLSSGSLNFGSIPTISESFMLNTCILSGVWNSGTPQALLTRASGHPKSNELPWSATPRAQLYAGVCLSPKEVSNPGVVLGTVPGTERESGLSTEACFQAWNQPFCFKEPAENEDRYKSLSSSPSGPALFFNCHLWAALPFLMCGWRFKLILFLLRVAT